MSNPAKENLRIEIHSTSIVSSEAFLEEGVQIGAYCVISGDVRIGAGSVIGPHTVVEGPTKIGRNNRFFGQASVGTDPQDLKFSGEQTCLEIGNDNVFREFVTLNRGTRGGGGITRIGNGCFLMTGVHVAHDCEVGDRVILANAATLAGHVTIGQDATVGAFSGVHQFCRIGVHAFVGGYSVLTRDVLPFIKTVGDRNHAKTYGVNRIGLQRKGFDRARLDALSSAYRILIRKGLKLSQAVSALEQAGLMTEDVRSLVEFMKTSERGYIR